MFCDRTRCIRLHHIAPGNQFFNSCLQLTWRFAEVNTKDALHQMFKDETGRYIGPDVGIEAAGFHYTKSWLHWLEMATKVENDP